MKTTVAADTLTLGIPADRNVTWTLGILSRLKKPPVQIKVLVSRWIEKPLSDKDLRSLNTYFPTQEVVSRGRYAPMMRNAILRSTKSKHILFLDDDMIPDAQLLKKALLLIQREPSVVHQGIPYHVANHAKWLARMEGKVYEKGFKKYTSEDNEVTLLDARVLLAPVAVLLKTPFDESIIFGGGEGRELATELIKRGVKLKLAPDLIASHINRETLTALIAQKRAHGRGRGHMLLDHGPGQAGWPGYIAYYFRRHFKEPIVQWLGGKIHIDELSYVLGTNIIFWLGALEEIARNRNRRKK